MTYVLLDEINQTIQYPPINKGDICNYNLSEEHLIADGYPNIEDSLIQLFNEGKGKIVGNTIEDISETQEYKNAQRLKEITQELNQSDITYNNILNTPIEYTNGHVYKPKYINDYILLIASTMSYEIWSDDETYSEIMDTAKITELCLFLKSVTEPAYQIRKMTRKALLEEEKDILQS